MSKPKTLFLLLLFVPVSLLAQQDSVRSGAYEWKTAIPIIDKISSSILLEGTVHDFKWMQITSNVITSAKKFKQHVADSYEQLIIVKSGSLKFHLTAPPIILLQTVWQYYYPAKNTPSKKQAKVLLSFFQ